MKHINNVFMVSLKKTYYIFRWTNLFSKNSKNYSSDDTWLQKKCCNASQIIYWDMKYVLADTNKLQNEYVICVY